MAARRPAATPEPAAPMSGPAGQDRSGRSRPGPGGPRSTGSDVACSRRWAGKTPSSVVSGAPALTGARRPGTRQWRAACRAAGDAVSRGSGCRTMTHAPSRAHPDRNAARPGHMPAASHPPSGPRRAGPGQPRYTSPGEHITMRVIRGRSLRVAMRDGNPGVAAAAAVQRLRRPPRNAAAVRRRAGSAADHHPVRHAGPGPIPRHRCSRIIWPPRRRC
jgi:hypothetical protein